MISRRKLVLRSLLLLLVAIGPLKAHVVFACDMMDTVVLEVCCCDDMAAQKQGGCVDDDCGAAGAVTVDPCCDVTSALSLDAESRDATPVLSPWELRSDVDPPDGYAAITSFHPSLFQQRLPASVLAAPAAPALNGTSTYLLTARLRI